MLVQFLPTFKEVGIVDSCGGICNKFLRAFCYEEILVNHICEYKSNDWQNVKWDGLGKDSKDVGKVWSNIQCKGQKFR